jgi:hypothetical protein
MLGRNFDITNGRALVRLSVYRLGSDLTENTCQNACLLARYPALAMARTTQKTPLLLSECVFI